MTTNWTEITTSAAVFEIKVIYALLALFFSLLGYGFIGFFILILPDSETNTSIESTITTYFSTAWIIVIEFTLFFGILMSTIVVLFSVMQFLRCCWYYTKSVQY